jgi:hypothetical protein
MSEIGVTSMPEVKRRLLELFAGGARASGSIANKIASRPQACRAPLSLMQEELQAHEQHVHRVPAHRSIAVRFDITSI